MNVDKFIIEIERTFNIPESGIILEDFRPSLNLIRIMKVLVSDEDPSNSVFQVLKFWEPCDIEALDDDDASAILELQNIIDDMEKIEKPPLGLIPRRFWEVQLIQERITMIKEAINRYLEAKKDIPYEWIRELSEHQAELERRNYERIQGTKEEGR
jgi:hypothetical protein|nr:MAG TPA: hypothetical protein [Caudoviricetes sp.]